MARFRFYQVARWLSLCMAMHAWFSPLATCNGQDKPATAIDETIATLVSRLGSQEFAVRESAMNELSRVDEKKLADLEQLLKGLKPEELESRIRLSSIIVRIKSDRTLKQTRNFLRSSEQNETFGFEGWKSFVKISGASRNAKMVFLKLIDLYPELLFTQLESKKDALDKARVIAGAIAQKRRADRPFAETQGYDLADAIALLYCLSVADDVTDRNMESISISTFRISPFSQFLLDPQYKKTMERMITGWANRIEERKVECMALLVDKDFSQAKNIALRILDSTDLDSFAFIRSMQCIYRFGDASDLPRIEKWLEDKTVLFALPIQGPGNAQGLGFRSAEYRDAALLVSMHLSGADYSTEFPEFQSLPLWGFREETLLMPPNSDAVRSERVAKWKAEQTKTK